MSLRLSLLFLGLVTSAAVAQTPADPQPVAQVDPQAADRAACAAMLAQQNQIEMGAFPSDQLQAHAHGTSAVDLSNLAAKSADRNAHYQACVNYALAAATYLATGGKDARSNTSTAMQLAAMEQKLGDGKKLGFLDKALRTTSRLNSTLAASKQNTQTGSSGTPPAGDPAAAAPPAAVQCAQPPCGP